MGKPNKKPDDAVSLNGGGSNTEATFKAIASEMVSLEDEIDRLMEPLKERRKDLAATAKAAKINVAALKRSVKIKRADNAKRKKYAEEIQAEEIYLNWLQIDLFKEAA